MYIVFLLFPLNLASYLYILLRDDCLSVEFTLCLGPTLQPFTDLNSPSGLIGWWPFDDAYGHDYTSSLNPLGTPPSAGPAMRILYPDGKGSSLSLEADTGAVIPHSAHYEGPEFTVCFWFYLFSESSGNWRSIFHKGGTAYELTPSLLLWPKERRLRVSASTSHSWSEGLDSYGLLNIRRWTHLALTGHGQLLQLYINSYLDNQMILSSSMKINKGDIHLGKNPWRVGVRGLMDDLRFYNEVLSVSEIRPLAQPAVPLAAVQGVSFGCQLCNYMEALESCNDDYHMCSLEELYTGVWEFAREMGWFRFTADIWTRNTLDQVTTSSDEIQDPNLFRLNICCKD